MDKQTLSNYGWIVICVLVLAVMIALATPFGTFVKGATENTTQGLFDVHRTALGVAGIAIDEQGFEDGSGSGGSTPTGPTEPQATIYAHHIIFDDGTIGENRSYPLTIYSTSPTSFANRMGNGDFSAEEAMAITGAATSQLTWINGFDPETPAYTVFTYDSAPVLTFNQSLAEYGAVQFDVTGTVGGTEKYNAMMNTTFHTDFVSEYEPVSYDGTDLTGTTWFFNVDYPSVTGGVYGVNFVSNGNSYTSLTVFGNGKPVRTINYGAYGVFVGGAWGDMSYRTIHITGGTDATNPAFIAWLEANAIRFVD